MIKLAVFPRSIDHLFFNTVSQQFQLVYLIARNTKEDEWTHRFLSPGDCLYYDIQVDDGEHFSQYGTDECLNNSNLGILLSNANITHLVLTGSATKATTKWASKHQIKLIVSDPKLQFRLEDKCTFDKLLSHYGLPKPHTIFSGRFADYQHDSIRSVVIQRSRSMGSEGTYIIHNMVEFDQLVQTEKINKNQKVLVRSYTPGKSMGLTLMITDQNTYVSSVRQQCFSTIDTKQVFQGIQWLSNRHQIIKLPHWERLGSLLYKMGFRGCANIDFILDHGKVYIIECNPRLSGSSTQLFAIPGLIDCPAAKTYISSIIDSKDGLPYSQDALRNYQYQGATFHIYAKKKNTIINKTFANGVYQYQNKTKLKFISADPRDFQRSSDYLIFHSEVTIGESYRQGAELATIIINFKVYNHNGVLDQSNQFLIDYFNME